MSRKKHQSKIWFRKVRGSYLPASWQGLGIYFIYLGFLITSYVYAYNNEETVLAVVFTLFPQWVAAVAVVHFLAAKKAS